jgi:hypothetical protein
MQMKVTIEIHHGTAHLSLNCEIVDMEESYSWLDLGFEIVTITRATTSRWSPGSAVNFEEDNTAIL